MEENKPVQNVQQTISPAPKSTNFLLIGLIVIFVAAFASGGTFLFMSQKQKNPEVTPLSQTKPTAIPTTDPTANWNTFTDKNLEYSVKYPNSWFTYPANGPKGESAIYSYDMTKVAGSGGISQDQLKFAVIRLTEDEENNNYQAISKENVTSESKIIVDGIEGTKQIWKSMGTGITITVKKNQFFYHIMAYQADSKYIETFNQILSTFKFTNKNENQTQSSNPNLKTYTSKTLGITFTYLGKQDTMEFTTKEIGNKVCVTYDPQDNNCSKGQFVEVFSKLKNQTLTDAIKQQFLSNYSEKDCFVNTNLAFSPNSNPAIKNYEKAEIGFPESSDPNDPGWQNADKCPAVYTTTNGIAYFLMDKDHADKFLFFSIGQYAITSENNKPWQNTLIFLD